MKRILLLFVLFNFVVKNNCLAQNVYAVYATEPSGIVLSPNTYSIPNTVTIKSGQRIKLNGQYEYSVAKWYGEGLPSDGSDFYNTYITPINSSTENITLTYKVNNSNTNAIIVTVLPAVGVIDPAISASTYCTVNPLLTATRCNGIVKWYKKQGNGAWEPYVKVLIPGAEGNTYQITATGDYCATCTVAGVESFGSETISSDGVQPFVSVNSTEPNTNICMWSDRTVQATGSGLEAGTLTWFEKIGTDPATEIGSGTSKNVEITNLNTSYYAQLAVSGCPLKTSSTYTFTVQEPTILANSGQRTFKAHVQSLNVLTDDNCQLLAGFAPGLNNNDVNVMLGKNLTVKVSRDNSIKLYNSQPYLQRHFDFEPQNPSEAVDAWYSIKMYFTQADFDAFNAVSSVKLPSNSTPEEQSKLTNLRIWQVHGTPLTIPATPANYSGGPATDYGCVACRSSNWNEAKNCWEVHLNTQGFSGFFVTTEGATALPVTLINFKAQKQENAVTLTWQTTEETNSDRFEIEHSVNSKQWVNIGSVVSHRESNSLQNYTHTHLTPVTGENLYRLKMIDRATDRQDGSFAYSRIVSVKMDARSDISLYPNPGYENVTVTSKIPVSAYKLVSATGQVIKEKQEQNQSLIHVPLAKVPPGIYVMQLSLQNGQVEYRKLVVQ
ncbi:T9SS type A sorting domain-containing protein [Dyadobacter sp. CY312]|uniref:T9SS type A sorting domain-containing protein n=1 Tax=Dyadobacter sp. CY312 TaxID=2907303 RepID=UPI001F259985|nr:T9SS type A sorting domain-containing protein [Dyadobacter sp. CY312]MCE7044314.1 T9SS type A sorting domain-containing protein [Dyadobacter sp. CY312]